MWSDDEKRRIVDEAVVPGASVAEIARRHGVNANLVFTWRRAARTTPSPVLIDSNAPTACAQGNASPIAVAPFDFIPVGVLGRAQDGDSALVTGSSPAEAGGTSSHRTTLPRPAMDDRPGVIEIDLVDGVRLRVDAFVNERALRRVLTVLKVAP